MKIKHGVILAGLNRERMRYALMIADKVWKDKGRKEGITITSGLDGTHSAGSEPYYGLAVDLRTRYWGWKKKMKVAQELMNRLGEAYDVVVESNHIHLEAHMTDKATIT